MARKKRTQPNTNSRIGSNNKIRNASSVKQSLFPGASSSTKANEDQRTPAPTRAAGSPIHSLELSSLDPVFEGESDVEVVVEEAVVVGEKQPLKFEAKDIVSEVDYWKTVVVCYALGANPPASEIAGFINRIWRKHGYDNISFLQNGVLRAWTPKLKLAKEKVTRVPVWIRIHDLDLKFWGKKCLERIADEVGKVVRCDVYTEQRIHVAYARILVAMEMDQPLVSEVQYLDEVDKLGVVRIEYEWLPVMCKTCNGFGDEAGKCTRRKVQQVWRKKIQPAPVQPAPILVPNPVEVHAVPGTPRVIVGLNNQVGFWNVRRLNSSAKQKEIKWFLHNNKVELFGLLETKIRRSGINKSVDVLGNNWSFCTNHSCHEYGRVWILWNPRVFRVLDIECDAQGIHVNVALVNGLKSFGVTMVYGFNSAAERVGLWDWLDRIGSKVQGPWMWCGDFNGVLAPDERIGQPVTLAEIRAFAECATGSFFTWNNKQVLRIGCFAGLMHNGDWGMEFSEAYAHFLPEGLFDHCSCLISLLGQEGRRNSMFKSSWNVQVLGTPMYRVVKRLKGLKDCFRWLNKVVFSNVEQNAQKRIQDELEAAQAYRFLQKASMEFLAQKAKVQWCEEGDANTAYFHSSIKARRRQNKVLEVLDMNGVLCASPEQINTAFEEFYKNLLGTCNVVENVHVPTVSKGPCVSEDHVQLLPGAQDVILAVQAFFRSGKLLKQLNATVLTLIPKKQSPRSVRDFRPIACCNVLYKCISKVLCSRMSGVLTDIISPVQTAFIRGRNIVENIHICQDLVRLYGRRACSPRVMLKVDLQKAYDTVEWSFVKEMLVALRFPDKFVQLVMECVTTPWFSIALNGEVFGFFQGKRRLRQGDPLSPLVFNVWMEYLSRIMGCLKSLALNHLYFADDVLIFRKGDVPSASGLKMNVGKTQFYVNGVSNEKEGLLWIKWIHAVYLKQRSLEDYRLSTNSSCTWRGVFKVWEKLKNGFIGHWWRSNGQRYTVFDGYQWLAPVVNKVPWASFVWNKVCVPKHSIIGWMMVQGRLPTCDRLLNWGIDSGAVCFLCRDGDETHEHLFFNCVYGKRCVQILNARCQVAVPEADVWCWWTRSRLKPLVKKEIIGALLIGLIYSIWYVRNQCRIDDVMVRPQSVVDRVVQCVKVRCNSVYISTPVSIRLWLMGL
ncbi:hypothetical protein RND81_01G095100 [Saponaria officinalis]|uniref:Reverse transcriptase domain-containing protein n=1 Tax=Saponaria officinalis TaxID=3572 RepID=A0AAW1N6R8_SAPOF